MPNEEQKSPEDAANSPRRKEPDLKKNRYWIRASSKKPGHRLQHLYFVDDIVRWTMVKGRATQFYGTHYSRQVAKRIEKKYNALMYPGSKKFLEVKAIKVPEKDVDEYYFCENVWLPRHAKWAVEFERRIRRKKYHKNKPLKEIYNIAPDDEIFFDEMDNMETIDADSVMVYEDQYGEYEIYEENEDNDQDTETG